MKKFITLLAVVAMSQLTGCATQWAPRSTSHATVYSRVVEIPVLYADSTFIEAVNDVQIDRSKGYALVPPGRQRLTVSHVNCPLPIVVIFCLKSAHRTVIEAELQAGVAYVIEGAPPRLVPIDTSLPLTGGLHNR